MWYSDLGHSEKGYLWICETLTRELQADRWEWPDPLCNQTASICFPSSTQMLSYKKKNRFKIKIRGPLRVFLVCQPAWPLQKSLHFLFLSPLIKALPSNHATSPLISHVSRPFLPCSFEPRIQEQLADLSCSIRSRFKQETFFRKTTSINFWLRSQVTLEMLRVKHRFNSL